MRYTLIIATLFCFQAFSQTQDQILTSRIDSLVTFHMQMEKVAGVALGVVKNGRAYYVKGYGVKDIRHGGPVDSVTNFHLASISKVFVATAVMQLVEQGKIDLDKKLLDYVPVAKLKDKRFKEITIRQMLMHMSGIPDVMNYRWAHPRNDSLALGHYTRRKIRLERLKFDPGAKFRYSNMAFEMLGHVVEVVSGKPFDGYEYEHVLKPAGLGQSNFDYFRIDPSRRSSPHIKRFGKVKVSRVYPYNREHGPSSTLNSCVDDMCRWIIEMQRIYDDSASSYGGVLAHESLTKMWSAQHKAFPSVSIGLSWFIFETPLGLGVAHNGGDRGYGSILLIYPEHKTGVIMLINGDYGGSLFETPQVIAQMVSGRPIQKVELSEAYAALLEGKYISTNDPQQRRTIHIKKENGELNARDGSYRYKITYLGDGNFVNPNDGATLQFNTKDQNAITLLLFGSIQLKKVK